MKGENLPDGDHIVRYVPFSKLLRDGDKPVGFLFSAFQLRDSEDGLSATWLEYFAGDRVAQTTAAVRAFRASLKVGSTSGFAIGQVGAIKSAAVERKHKIRVIHWPVDGNSAHAEIRQFPRDDVELLQVLANQVWAELVLNASIAPGAEPAPAEPAPR